MRKFCLTFFALSMHVVVLSQGCIPIRSVVGFGQFARPEGDPLTGEPTKLLINISQRYYKAYQTFNDDKSVQEKTFEVKTTSLYVMNIAFTKFLGKGWSFSFDLPISSGSRTAWRPEHFTSDTTKHTTHAFGIGDVRITAYKWLWDVSSHYRGNLQIGLGIKLPTGDFRSQDYFYQKDTVKVLAPVNTTIQPGDGGTGIITEINAYYNINRSINLYANVFYLFNPRDQNGVSNTFGGPARVKDYPEIPSYIPERATASVTSVPDTYTLRLGANYALKNFSLWLGARMEGAPVHDLIGSSNGQRRAGKIISAEPGINYKFKKTIIYAFMPVPVFRQTKQTVPDKRISDETGKYIASPGGFAKYQIFVGVLVKM